MLVHTVAPWVISLAFVGSVVFYAIGGHDEQAGRLFGSSIGGLIALVVVYFLKYVPLSHFQSKSNLAVGGFRMKLSRINKPLRSVPLRIVLTGELNARLEQYAHYYEHVHGESVDTRALIVEILRAFLEADREFLSWSRSAEARPHRLPAPASSNSSAKAQP